MGKELLAKELFKIQIKKIIYSRYVPNVTFENDPINSIENELLSYSFGIIKVHIDRLDLEGLERKKDELIKKAETR